MKTVEQLLRNIGVKNYTNRHLRNINDFLLNGEKDIESLLEKLGS